ncbi:RNA-directed DNA polymerase [candidate division KSB1 bacterium]|nr:RNA-directed DNA polymerase [candidate division KSB1 bacterium]
MFDFPQVYKAYLACRRNKRNKPSALDFEQNHEENLVALVDELRERRYQPSTSVCFYTSKPKAREVFAAAFRDRVVHHLLCSHLEPVWEKIFIHHSYACRSDKGPLAAAQTLQTLLRRLTANGKRPAFFLKMDVKNFFMTINRQLLFEMLAKHCPHPHELLWLVRVLVFHDPTQDYELQDAEGLRHRIPPHKTLFGAPPGCGLPIGNYTSQFFANVYLNALDQFVKHVLKCRFYLRYVDDFILLARHRWQLAQWQQAIRDFLKTTLQLEVHEKMMQIGPVHGGIDFAGCIVRPGYQLVRRRNVGNLKEKLRQLRPKLAIHTESCTAYRFDLETLEKTLATINSYLGLFRHAQTGRLVEKLFQQHVFLQKFFLRKKHKIVRLDQALRRTRYLRQQIRWLLRTFPHHLCLVQVGSYFEAYGWQAEVLHQAAGLNLNAKWRGFSPACGFPKKQISAVLSKLKSQRLPVVVVEETGHELRHTKQRLIAMMIEYPENEVGQTAKN